MNDQFAPRIGKKHKICIERAFPSNPRLNGYLLAASADLGLMHCFDDFEPDGYTVFRLADVLEVCYDDRERHWDRMLAAEGLLDGLNLTAEIDLSTMRAVIESIDRHFHRMIVECEMEEEDDEDFYIGKLAALNDTELQFYHFDGLGRWESEAAIVPLAEITLIQFETPYIQRFWRYIDRPSPSEIA